MDGGIYFDGLQHGAASDSDGVCLSCGAASRFRLFLRLFLRGFS